jgi:hypothetical protein
VLPPPPQGDPYQIVPPGIGNPGQWGVVVAWDAYRLLGGTVIDQAMADMWILQGVPV